jgi:hypothetical protein
MITYANFAERLARGQLKNTAAVEDTNLGEICPDYTDTILNLTNQGLVDITTRLPLLRRLVDLTFVTDQFAYPLTDASLATYLDDSETDTFVEASFVKVLDVYDADGKRYQPNSGGHIITPIYDTLRFTSAMMDSDTGIGPKVRIQYQAKHLEITDVDSIDLPPNMIAALQLFVASQFISDMGGKEHTIRGDGYLALYMRHVAEDEVRNTSGTSEVEMDTRFADNGFV